MLISTIRCKQFVQICHVSAQLRISQNKIWELFSDIEYIECMTWNICSWRPLKKQNKRAHLKEMQATWMEKEILTSHKNNFDIRSWSRFPSFFHRHKDWPCNHILSTLKVTFQRLWKIAIRAGKIALNITLDYTSYRVQSGITFSHLEQGCYIKKHFIWNI